MTLIVTDVGLAKAVQAEVSGINLVIAEVAIGANGYTPDSTMTSLQNEIIRKVLTGGKKVASNQISLQVLIDDDGEIVGREIGFYLDDGTLFAVDSDPDNIITYKSATQGSLALETFDLVLDSIPPDTITVSVIGNMIEHEAKSDPHPQYLLNTIFASRKVSTNSPLSGGGSLSDDLTLEIESAALLQVGVPIPWPTETVPTGFLECNGANFDTKMYTELVKIYTDGALPDLRGEFIRGWDNGRGVDVDRAIMSSQADTLQGHYHSSAAILNRSGVGSKSFGHDADQAYMSSNVIYGPKSDGTNGTPRISSETRPCNIAFMYILRAG